MFSCYCGFGVCGGVAVGECLVGVCVVYVDSPVVGYCVAVCFCKGPVDFIFIGKGGVGLFVYP